MVSDEVFHGMTDESAPAPLNPEQRRERARQAYHLRIQGLTIRQIGKRLNVSHTTARNLCRRVESVLAARFEDNARFVRVRQLAQLDHIANEALRGWQRSQRNAETTETTKEAMEGDGGPENGRGPSTLTRTKKTVKGQTGDSAMLRTALDALAAQRQLLGLNKQAGPSASDGDEITTKAPTFNIGEVRVAILAALDHFPDARNALAKALLDMGRNDTDAKAGN
jgi:hypothetical protein